MSLGGAHRLCGKGRAGQRHLCPGLQTPAQVPGQGPRHMSAGPASLPAPRTQLWSSGTKPTPLLLLAGSQHAITIFSLTTLIVSIIMACVATFLGKMSKRTNYEVSCQPAFPPASSPRGRTQLEDPPPAWGAHSIRAMRGSCLSVWWWDGQKVLGVRSVCVLALPQNHASQGRRRRPLLFPTLTSPPNCRLLAHPSYDVSLSSHRAAGAIPRDGELRERME